MLTHANSQTLDVPDPTDTLKIDETITTADTTLRTKTGRPSKKNVSKPHKCEHCDRAFVSRSLLSSHVRTHTGERYAFTKPVVEMQLTKRTTIFFADPSPVPNVRKISQRKEGWIYIRGKRF